jgi:bifunctional oligoribonuclease and PAP phosphatase NrnA
MNNLLSGNFPQAMIRDANHLVKNSQEVVVISHVRPDGDAIGSVLGLGLALKDAGKSVQMVLLDGLPASFRHLSGSELIKTTVSRPYDLAIVVDCSDLDRIGEALNPQTPPDLNIDHHATNLLFGRLNFVDTQAVSTTAMLADLLPALGLAITRPVACALLTGLITDSLGFRTPNMTAESLRIAAGLVEAGADLPELYFQSLTRRSYESARLWGIGLANLRHEDDLGWTSISIAERRAVGYPGNDDADLVNILTTINGINVAVIFLEQPDGRVKISWRSKQGYDISELALRFGGGGHPNAAGASVEGPLSSVQIRVLEATKLHIQTPASRQAVSAPNRG